MKLRYKWRKTWPDSENDFVGFDGDCKIGRFHVTNSSGEEKWVWFLQAEEPDVDRGAVTLNGVADSAREAARQLEESYIKAKRS